MNEHPDYSGMTVNERLFEAGLLDRWDRAAKLRDRETMTQLLTKVQIAVPDLSQIVATILANPTKYGF